MTTKYAQIANGEVLLVREFESSPGPGWIAISEAPKPAFDPAAYECVSVGWDLSGAFAVQKWLLLSLPAPDAPVVLSGTNPVPSEVVLGDFRAAIILLGLQPQVEALIAALPEPNHTIAKQKWEYGNFISRNHPLVLAFASELNPPLTDAQIDDVFRQAASLK